MANLRITRLGHGGVLYRSPGDSWIWVDRWSGSQLHEDCRNPEKVDVVAPTHCHFDHVGTIASIWSSWPGWSGPRHRFP